MKGLEAKLTMSSRPLNRSGATAVDLLKWGRTNFSLEIVLTLCLFLRNSAPMLL